MTYRNIRSFIIYGLIDPRTGEIRYVGKSCYGLDRPRRHKTLTKKEATHKANWIKELQRNGLTYEILVLEHCSSHEEVLDAEERWILAGFRLCWPLTNLTITERAGARRGPPSAETRAKISAAKKGKPRPDLLGKPRPDLTALNKTRVKGKEERAKLAAAAIGNKRGAGFQMTAKHRKTMSALREQEWAQDGWRRNDSPDGLRRNPK